MDNLDEVRVFYKSEYDKAKISFFTSEACHWLISTTFMEIVLYAGILLAVFGHDWFRRAGIACIVFGAYFAIQRGSYYHGYIEGFVNRRDDPQDVWSDSDKQQWIPIIEEGINKSFGLWGMNMKKKVLNSITKN